MHIYRYFFHPCNSHHGLFTWPRAVIPIMGDEVPSWVGLTDIHSHCATGAMSCPVNHQEWQCIMLYIAFCTIMTISRHKEVGTGSMHYSYFKWLQWFFKVHSTIGSTRLPGKAVYIALRCFLHNHGNITTEGSPKPGLCPTLTSNDFKGSL